MDNIYELPEDIHQLFKENEDGYYRIIDRQIGEMDNLEAMKFFIDHVNISSKHILLDDGTQVTFSHPNYNYHIVIDSSGLGDMYSHQFEVTKCDFEYYQEQLINSETNSEINYILKKDTASYEDIERLFQELYK